MEGGGGHGGEERESEESLSSAVDGHRPNPGQYRIFEFLSRGEIARANEIQFHFWKRLGLDFRHRVLRRGHTLRPRA